MKPGTKRIVRNLAGMLGFSILATYFLNDDHDRIAESRRRMGIQAKGAQQSRDGIGRRVWRHQDYHQDLNVSTALLALDTASKVKKGREGEKS